MRHFFGRMVFLLSALLLVSSCQEEERLSLSYTIRPVQNDSLPLLEVLLDLPPNPAGFTRLHYANTAWGEEELHRALFSLQMEPERPDNRVEINKDSGWIDLHYSRDLNQLKFRYQLQQDFDQAKLSTSEVYRPIIQENYFHLFSHHLFMGPATEKPLDIAVRWADFSEDYVIHNSFGTGQRIQRLESVDWNDFQSAIFVGGDFRVYQDELMGNKISLATRGDWIPFEEEEVFAILKETLEAQREFWNDHSQAYFTVSLHPFGQEQGSSFQGTGLTNSFATSVSNNSYTDLDQLVYLFNHELMHNWIGHRIENSNEEEQYWFSEGFTEYYTFKNIARNGVGGAEESSFFSSLNLAARQLYSSPVREEPNSQINYENFWSNPDYGKLPYYRGALFAFLVDMQIIHHSAGRKSLDDMMREFLVLSQQGKRLSHELFLEVLEDYWEEGKTYFDRHIIRGEFFDFAKEYARLGLQYEPEAVVYEMGFELSDDRKQIKSVQAGTAAEKAGLQAGDLLFSRSIWYGNTEKPIDLGVVRGKKQLQISFFPIKRVQLPQLIESGNNWDKLQISVN